MKKRELKYEVIRVFSMIFILSIHEINTFMDKSSMLYYVLATIFMAGVPCFFMLSGKFAFNIDYEDKDYLMKYYKKKFINLLIPVFIYMMIKEFHIMAYNLHKEITVYSYLRSLFVSLVNGFSYMEYWFIYILVANLLIAPFIGKFITKATKKEATVFLAIPFIVNIISTLLGYFELEFKLSYAFAGYSFYFYLGYFLDRFSETKKEKTTIYILGTISTIITLILLNCKKAVNIWGWSPTFTLISIMIYVFIRDHIKMNKIENIILFMGKYSLSVYMLHMIFIYTFNDIIPKEGMNSLLYGFIIIVLSYISSLISGFILENTIIKYLKKITSKIKIKGK